MSDRSTDRLITALVGASAPVALVERARRGDFHDFKSGSATPIIDLVLACEEAGLRGVADAAINGDFDATSQEADEWAESVEGREAFQRLVSGE